MAVESNRALALKYALEHIDRHHGKFQAKEEQDKMLEKLIVRHDLKERPRNILDGGHRQEVKLTVKRYRNILATTAGKHSKHTSTKKIKLQDIFMKGAVVVADSFLTKIKYDANTSSIDSENEGEEDGEDEEDELEEIPASDNADNVQSVSSESTIILGRASGTTTPVNETERQLSGSEKESASPAPEATSIIRRSPRVVIPSLRLKRKVDVEGDEMARPSSVPKIAAHTAIVPTSSTNPARPGDAQFPIQEHSSILSSDEGGSEQHILPATIRNATLPAGRFNATVGLVKLSNDAIIKGMDGIWNDIQSFARKLLDGVQIDGNARAVMILKPSPELHEIYVVLFGPKWQQRARQLLLAGMLDARGIIEACVAAAAWMWVWEPELPWRTPANIMDMLLPEAEQIERVLHESDPNLHLQTIVFQAGNNKILDKAFQQHAVLPYAKSLADRFMLTIDAQVEALGANRDKISSDKDQERRTDHVAHVFFKALVLKGQIKAAPDYYRYAWAISSATAGQMEQVHPGQGAQEVAWGVTPIVEKKATQNAEWEVICPAKGFCKPAGAQHGI